MKRIAFSLSAYLLWFAAVFDPIGNLFQLRYVALGYALICVLFSLSLKTFTGREFNLRNLLILCLTLIMPICGILLYSFRAGDAAFVDTSYIASGILIITTLLYYSEKMSVTGINAMVLALRLLSILILSVFIFVIFGQDFSWISFFTESNVAIISAREYSGITLPYINFLAGPMLIYLIGYDINNFKDKRTLFSLLVCTSSIISFALTGTRAHIVIALAYPFAYYILVPSKNKFISAFTLSIFLLVATLVFAPDLIGEFFSTKETSNEQKLQLLDMYLGFFSNPLTLFFGQGFNAHEWAPSLRDKFIGLENASKTELTYFELIRVFGLIISAFFFSLIAALVYKSSKLASQYRWLYPAFLISLLNSAVNPYLFSTNGILPLALLLALVSFNTSPKKQILDLEKRTLLKKRKRSVFSRIRL